MTVTSLSFGNIAAGQESEEVELVLWNNKAGVYAVDTATNTVVAVRNEISVENPVEQGWIYARSDGIENPDSVQQFFDDDDNVYHQLSSFQNLYIGDIPNNCGRHVFVKLVIPSTAGAQTDVSVRLLAASAPLFYPLPYFSNRMFGDGVVDNVVRQIFPPIQYRRVGTWTDIYALAGGAYTGSESKQYLVRIISGTTLGLATFDCSDDGGDSYSTSQVTSTTSFLNVLTSDDQIEGVKVRWFSPNGSGVTVGDIWAINVDLDPFALKPGTTTSNIGFIGFGEALVSNNVIKHQAPSAITGLTTDAYTYVFIEPDGTYSTSYSANQQRGKLLLGWFLSNSTGVVAAGRLAPRVALGLDVFDDFAPVWNDVSGFNVSGLTWAYFRGKFRKFDEVITVPPIGTFPAATMSLIAGMTNYIQLDVYNNQVVGVTKGYLPDNLPLFRVLTGMTYIESWQDDRTRLGITSLKGIFVGTKSTVSNNTSASFDLPDFINRGVIKKLIVTPTVLATGYTVAFYSDTAQNTLQYEAGSLTDVFTDNFLWMWADTDENKTLHGYVTNATGATCTFTFELAYERFS